MIERILCKDKLLALILRSKYEPEGVEFFTSQDNPIQLGIMKHEKDYQIKPHVHKNISRTIQETQEVLHIEYGLVEVIFYDEDGNKVNNQTLYPNDTILLITGGHSFKMLEDSKMIEIKQGPYLGVDEDKIRFGKQ